MASKVEYKHMSEKVCCLICAEDVKPRKMIECPYCQFSACIDCTETFLMGIDDLRPRCMENSCKAVWSGEFLASKFHSSFYNKKYLDRRASLLHEREKSLLPGTQDLVREEKIKIAYEDEVHDLYDDIAMYKQLIANTRAKIRKCDEARRLQTGLSSKKKSNRVFTRSCPVEDCRGFLSTSLKCGLCSTYACKDCHQAKESKDDDDHKCNPDTVATIKLLADDTKPCPACATPIYKISGCDQMYCTTCHTAFSWDRGTIETGVVHNPHFYAFQREQNGGIAPRVGGDIRCGGLPYCLHFTAKLEQCGIDWPEATYSHMVAAHIQAVEIPRYPVVVGDTDNSKHRVDYLMGRIDEKKWISLLKKQMKKQEKDMDYNQVLTMFVTTMSDLIGNIIEPRSTATDVSNYVVSMNNLREYTNKALKQIGIRHGCVYPGIDAGWRYCRNIVKAKEHTRKMKKQEKNEEKTDGDAGDRHRIRHFW